MSHTRITVLTTPQQHERLLNELSSRKYYVEGPLFKGHTKPVINEIKTYDIRMYAEGVPQMLRDLNAFDLAGNIRGNVKHHIPFSWLVSIIMRLFRRLTKHYVPEYINLPCNKLVDKGWHYCFVWGTYIDPKEKNDKEEL